MPNSSCLFTDGHVLNGTAINGTAINGTSINGTTLTVPLTVDTSTAATLAGDFSSVSFEKIPNKLKNKKKTAKHDSPGRDSGYSDQHQAVTNGISEMIQYAKADEESALSEEEIFADAVDNNEVSMWEDGKGLGGGP